MPTVCQCIAAAKHSKIWWNVMTWSHTWYKQIVRHWISSFWCQIFLYLSIGLNLCLSLFFSILLSLSFSLSLPYISLSTHCCTMYEPSLLCYHKMPRVCSRSVGPKYLILISSPLSPLFLSRLHSMTGNRHCLIPSYHLILWPIFITSMTLPDSFL